MYPGPELNRILSNLVPVFIHLKITCKLKEIACIYSFKYSLMDKQKNHLAKYKKKFSIQQKE